jgi:LmbE family N-acetylglucosaminyl deacetylase
MTYVFFHAHPDDEAIFTGGTIARLTERGVPVAVVLATGGEGGIEPAGGSGSPVGPLSSIRRQESELAAKLLGVDHLAFLGYRDSGLGSEVPADAFALAPVEEAAGRLARVLAEVEATAMIYYDEGGIYGHADHLAVYRIGQRAAALAGLETVYEATVDREHLHFVATHLVGHAVAALHQEAGYPPGGLHEPPPTGVPTVEVTTTIDVTTVIEKKRSAMAAHASQIPTDSEVLTMDADTFNAVYGLEWFIRTGPATGLDTLAMEPAMMSPPW